MMIPGFWFHPDVPWLYTYEIKCLSTSTTQRKIINHPRKWVFMFLWNRIIKVFFYADESIQIFELATRSSHLIAKLKSNLLKFNSLCILKTKTFPCKAHKIYLKMSLMLRNHKTGNVFLLSLALILFIK